MFLRAPVFHLDRQLPTSTGPPGPSQKAVGPGETYDSDIMQMDTGMSWYHAHARKLSDVLRVNGRVPPTQKARTGTPQCWRITSAARRTPR